jgi:hypothetical protein
MGEKRVSPRVVFLLVLLIAIGVFLLFSRLTFTGYVTSEYFSGSATINDFSNASVFENTKFDGTSAVVLDNLTLVKGNFTSPFFAAPNDTEVIWTNFVPDDSMSSHSSISYYYRACNDNLNCAVEFIPIASSSLLVGKYFQYKAEMQTSVSSPKIFGVAVNYHTPLNLPINIGSPSNITYNNETVLLNIIANGSSVWFYDGASNETYIGEINKTFSEGTHVITAWVGDAHGNMNSTSVTFTVGFIRTFYRLQSNVCSAVSITTAQKTANDYSTVSECQSHVTNSSSSNTTEQTLSEITEECAPNWVPSEWSVCVGGKQTRTCVDANECTDTTEVCPIEQDCVVTETPVSTPVETPTTTSAENQSKGFLSIVGSAIATPFNYMFGNRTRIFIFSAVLLLVVGGFLVFKFSPEVRLRVLKLLNIRRRKSSSAD